jgi:hypothetical protein
VSEHVIERERDAELVELGDDVLRTNVATVAERSERVFERVTALDMKAEEMDFAVAVGSTQLDARDDADAERRTRDRGFGHAGHRVVVGDGDCR